jgi:hypothetical protein
MRSHLLTFLFLSLFISLSAQDVQVITGKVIDKDTRKPLGYTHVGIEEKGIGTYSGYDGRFTLKVPERYSNSTIVVSFIGYENYRLPLSKVKGPVTVELQNVATQMPEVVVMEESRVEDLIRRAVRRIPDNYPTQPTSLTGFYRESKTDENDDYIYLAEGVLDIYKTGYKNDKEGQTALVQGRQIVLNPEQDVDDVAYISSGHLSAHRFDFVKYREDFIDEENFPDYKYWIEGITTFNDRPVYIIAFDKAEDGRGRMKGKVFIDTTSYAFIRAEFEIRPEGLKKRSDYPLYMGNWKGNRYVVNYRQTGDEWHFSSALREGKRPDGGVFSNDILITEVQPGKGKNIPYLDRLERGDPFLEMTGTYDEQFWKQYNTTPMSSGLASSVQQLKTRQIAEEVFDSTFMAQLQARRDSIQRAELQAAMREQGMGNEDFEVSFQRELTNFDVPRFPLSVQMHIGLGAHLLETQATNLSVSYLDELGQPLITLADEVPERQFEGVLQWDLALVFKKRHFFQLGFTRDFYNSIYAESHWGVGTQLNLTPWTRPFWLRPSVSFSRLRYGSLLGTAQNDNGKFKAFRKNLKTDELNVYYGARTDNLKLSLELAFELNPDRDLYIRGSYFLPFNYQEHIYLREKPYFWLTRRKSRIPLEEGVLVERNDAPFNGRITEFQSFMVTVGMNFK